MKQVFNVIVYTGSDNIGSNGYVKYRKVNSINKFRIFINNKYPNWKFATIYDHNTKEKIEIIKP